MTKVSPFPDIVYCLRVDSLQEAGSLSQVSSEIPWDVMDCLIICNIKGTDVGKGGGGCEEPLVGETRFLLGFSAMGSATNNCNTLGNHGWVGHLGTTIMPSACSCSILVRHFPISEMVGRRRRNIGTNQYKTHHMHVSQGQVSMPHNN